MFRPPGPVPHEPIDDFEIRPVTDATTARDWEHALVHGYPEPALQPFEAGCFLPERALAAPRWRHWVGYLAGEAVGTASALVGDHHVDVEFISTLESARGRGIGRALTAVAVLAAPELPAMLISSDPGRTVYERLGFIPLLRFTLWAGHR
jgi:GNAT superfamily N-acetyltransferase